MDPLIKSLLGRYCALVLAGILGASPLLSCRSSTQSPAPGPPGPIYAPMEADFGTVSIDVTGGRSSYEGNERELVAGVTLRKSIVLMPADPANPEGGLQGVEILRLANRSGQARTIELVFEIPKTFAQHVDQLRFALASVDPGTDTVTLLANTAPALTIDALVASGDAQVIDEDPSVAFLIALGVLGTAAALELFIFHVDKSHFVSVTPMSTVGDFEANHAGSPDLQLKWADRRLGRYCDAIRRSAARNNIPPRLLATVLLNELVDYKYHNQLEELVPTTTHTSGIAQLEVTRVVANKTIDVGPAGQIRDPAVDVAETGPRTIKDHWNETGTAVVPQDINYDVWKRLVAPEPSIEIAAREISLILDKLKKGSPALKNPWARALLANPDEGIDRSNVLANLRPPSKFNGPQQVALEGTLAVLVVAPYNGNGAILGSSPDIFANDINPWAYPAASNGWEAPRVHAVNAMNFWSAFLYDSWCLSARTDPGRSISGRISGAAVANISVQLSGAAATTARSDPTGRFVFAGLANGEYDVTPIAGGYTFSPVSRHVAMTGPDVTGQDFSATQCPAPVTDGVPCGAFAPKGCITGFFCDPWMGHECKQKTCPTGAGWNYTHDCCCDCQGQPYRSVYDPCRAGYLLCCVPNGSPAVCR